MLRTSVGVGRRVAMQQTIRHRTLAPPTPLTAKEYRMAVKMRKKGFPECHREFMDFMSAMQQAEFDDEKPSVQAALKILEQCYEEKEMKKKRQKPSINYHLARYTEKIK